MLTKKQFYILLITSCILGWAWVLIHVLKLTNKTTSLQVCLLKNITNLPCAACGTTRGVTSFFNGDIYQSFLHNPLSWLVVAVMFVLPLILVIDFFTKKNYCYKKFNNLKLNLRSWILIVCIFILCWAWNLYKHYNHINF